MNQRTENAFAAAMFACPIVVLALGLLFEAEEKPLLGSPEPPALTVVNAIVLLNIAIAAIGFSLRPPSCWRFLALSVATILLSAIMGLGASMAITRLPL